MFQIHLKVNCTAIENMLSHNIYDVGTCTGYNAKYNMKFSK